MFASTESSQALLEPDDAPEQLCPVADSVIPQEPSDLEEPSDSDIADTPMTDDAKWEVFVADDDQRDLLPEPGDFAGEDSGFGDQDSEFR